MFYVYTNKNTSQLPEYQYKMSDTLSCSFTVYNRIKFSQPNYNHCYYTYYILGLSFAKQKTKHCKMEKETSKTMISWAEI